jgi:methyl-accepting chemotaxis protein
MSNTKTNDQEAGTKNASKKKVFFSIKKPSKINVVAFIAVTALAVGLEVHYSTLNKTTINATLEIVGQNQKSFNDAVDKFNNTVKRLEGVETTQREHTAQIAQLDKGSEDTAKKVRNLRKLKKKVNEVVTTVNTLNANVEAVRDHLVLLTLLPTLKLIN